jgi:hypothetical protein
MTKVDNDKVIAHIKQTFDGGERTLAGKRASEFIFGASKKPNEKLQEAVVERIPGIAEYIVAPASPPVENVPDHGGNPLSDQPEAKAPAMGESNLSSQKGKEEQNAIDKALEPGRKQREKANVDKDLDHTGSTKLNPGEEARGDTSKKP